MGYQRHPHRNIVLTGFLASGKTVVGRELSRRMRRPFVDVQAEAKRRARTPLHVLLPFTARPDADDSERRLVSDLAYRRESIIALGPDLSSLADNLAELEDFSMVAFLDPPFDLLWKRISNIPAYAPLVEQHGRMGLFVQWSDLRQEMLDADIVVGGAETSILRAAQLISHCFYT